MNASASFWCPLPPLELRGVGQPDVESALYYVQRLAAACNTSAASILRASCKNASNVRIVSSASVCGQSPEFVDRIEGLQRLGASEYLKCGSFWALKDVLAIRAIGWDSNRRRWCPTCFFNWSEESSYEPLIWSLGLQLRCRWHGCLLVEKCVRCGSSQPAASTLRKRLSCWKCRAALGYRAPAEEVDTHERWQERQCASLIALCSSNLPEPVKWNNYVDLIRGISDGVDGRETHGLRWLVNNSRRGVVYRPTINTLVSLAAFQGMDIREMLLDPAYGSTPLIDPERAFRWLPPSKRLFSPRVLSAVRYIASVLRREPPVIPPPGIISTFFAIRSEMMIEADPMAYAKYVTLSKSRGGAAHQWRLRNAFRVALAGIDRKRDKPTWRTTMPPILCSLGSRGLDPVTADSIVREALRLEAYRLRSKWHIGDSRHVAQSTAWLSG
ncbi:hypothetical protein J2X02_002900 [Pseudoxanthomonas japonensis]|nr:hypothetical protein [Pseudoxanthomonas japonensis]